MATADAVTNPEHLYQLALLVLVLPSIALNRVAITVVGAWVFGELAHYFVLWIGQPVGWEDALWMAARIVALGGALALSIPWDNSRRAHAQLLVALLFAVGAGLAAHAAINFDHPPRDMAEYHEQTSVYWLTYSVIMLQAIAVPFGNDWRALWRGLCRADEWVMRRLQSYFSGSL